MGHIGKRRVGLCQIAPEVLQRCPFVLPITVLRVQLDECAGIGERDERQVEGGSLGGGKVPGGESRLNRAPGWPSEVTNTRSHIQGIAEEIMGTSVTQIDQTYGHLVPDSEDYLRGLLDSYDRPDPPAASRTKDD